MIPVSPARLLIFILCGIAAVWTLTTLLNRSISEKANYSVEICLDFNDAVNVCQMNGTPLDEFLIRCRIAGATSIAIDEESLAAYTGQDASDEMDVRPGTMAGESIIVADAGTGKRIIGQLKERYGIEGTETGDNNRVMVTPHFSVPYTPSFWNAALPLGFSASKQAYVERLGYKTVLKVQNAGNPRWLDGADIGDISGILVEGKETPGYPGAEQEFAEVVRENGWKVIAVEFSTVSGMDKFKRLVPQSIVLGHTIMPKELRQYDNDEVLLNRWYRAVRERGVRCILFRFRENHSIEYNLSYLRTLCGGLKKQGYFLEPATPPSYPEKDGPVPAWWGVLTAAIAIPLVALVLGKRRRHAFTAYSTVNAVTLMGGLFVAALLSDVVYMQKIAAVPGVKAALLLPFLIVPYLLYSASEREHFWMMNIRVIHLAAIILVLGIAAIMIVRSGNAAPVWLQADHGFRQLIEQILAVRPRTKEFLIGQPLLFLGFYFRRKELLWCGLIGQVSIMNTFMHAHTPVEVSLVRVVHGMWLGLAVGILAAWIARVAGACRNERE